MASDPVFTNFLKRQHEEAAALNAASDFARITPLDAQRFAVALDAPCLVRDGSVVARARGCAAIVYFASTYLREHRPRDVVAIMGPGNLWHPNVVAPAVCLGSLRPGTSLEAIVMQLFEVVTYQRYSIRDPLHRDAADWMRDASAQWSSETGITFPLTTAPLRRRTLQLTANPLAPAAKVQ